MIDALWPIPSHWPCQARENSRHSTVCLAATCRTLIASTAKLSRSGWASRASSRWRCSSGASLWEWGVPATAAAGEPSDRGCDGQRRVTGSVRCTLCFWHCYFWGGVARALLAGCLLPRPLAVALPSPRAPIESARPPLHQPPLRLAPASANPPPPAPRTYLCAPLCALRTHSIHRTHSPFHSTFPRLPAGMASSPSTTRHGRRA